MGDDNWQVTLGAENLRTEVAAAGDLTSASDDKFVVTVKRERQSAVVSDDDEHEEAKKAREATKARWAMCLRLRAHDRKNVRGLAARYWNKWAKHLNAKLQIHRERSEIFDPNTSIEHPDEWVIRHSDPTEPGSISPLSRLLFEARSDFSKIEFASTETDFSGFIFPGEVDFRKCTFEHKVKFEGVHFHGPARFGGTTFKGEAFFGSAKRKTVFHEDAGFSGAKFTSETGEFTSFDSVEFKNLARFRSVQFSGVTFFGDCVFRGLFWAPQADFKNFTNFTRAIFHGFAVFGAIKSERAFAVNEVTFMHVPDFTEADFKQAPVLDTVKFEDVVLPRRFAWQLLGHTFMRDNGFRDWMRDRNRSAMWRNLRRIAVQGLDNDSEQKFLAAEIRTRRIGVVRADIREYNDLRTTLELRRVTEGVTTKEEAEKTRKAGERRVENCNGDRPTHARYIFGIAFGVFSDFGRSVARPLTAFLVVCVLAWAFYVGLHLHIRSAPGAEGAPISVNPITLYAGLKCLPGPNSDGIYIRPSPPTSPRSPIFSPKRDSGPLLEALYFTAGKALIFGSDPQDRMAQAQACLVGRHATASAAGPTIEEKSLVPNSPFLLTTISALQTLLCTACLFLIGLALRNKFKMR